MDIIYFIIIICWINSNFCFISGYPCPFGKFGRDCMSTCHCLDEADCDDTSGQCTAGCARGWDGGTCQRENVAFKQEATQKEGVITHNASLAVDDDMSTCSMSKSNVPGWWSVTLDREVRVSSVVIKAGSTSDIQGWKVYVGQEDNRMSMQMCATIRVSGKGATVRCGVPITGKHVMIVNRSGPIELCDFQAKACSPRWFGPDCSQMCNCANPEEICDSVSGACETGCEDGWTGNDCQTACSSGTYGQECKYECGNCANEIPCDHATGACNNGCQPGWTGMFCTQQCPTDAFGMNCQKCGRCYGIDSCDAMTGNCRHGCEAGYMGPQCLRECGPGWYGNNCSQICGHCANGTWCDPKIGVCRHGCEAGYQGVFCTQVCMKGYFGKSCGNRCENCFNDECDRVRGVCKLGCAPGFFGDQCTEDCPDGKFGLNCSNECGHCMQGQGRSCDPTSGFCQHGCKPGYQEDKCIQTCKEGFYGAGCQKCGLCQIGTVCDPFTGHCPQGCASEFFGDLCDMSEPFSDEDGPHVGIFFGIMITTVSLIMITVIACFLILWRLEDLPEMASPNKVRSNIKTGSHSSDHRERSDTGSHLLEHNESTFNAETLTEDTPINNEMNWSSSGNFEETKVCDV